jgi:hypothetical protein
LIKRPVKNSLGAYKHFGFVYGFDVDDTLWVIENNINGVECITYRDFLQGHPSLQKCKKYLMTEKVCKERIIK